MPDVDLTNYITVAERLNAFYFDKFPEGRLEASEPKVVMLDGHSFIQVRATAWRTVDDPKPAKATAWEPFPGKTNFTRDSEMMNAETSAIGRVLAMCGVEVRADIASQNEVRGRQEEAARMAAQPDPDAPVGAAGARYFIKFAKEKRGLTDEEIEDLVAEATEGRTGEVTGVLQREWEGLRDITRKFYEQRAGVPEVRPTGNTRNRARQVEETPPGDAVPGVQVPVDRPGVKSDLPETAAPHPGGEPPATDGSSTGDSAPQGGSVSGRAELGSKARR